MHLYNCCSERKVVISSSKRLGKIVPHGLRGFAIRARKTKTESARITNPRQQRQLPYLSVKSIFILFVPARPQ